MLLAEILPLCPLLVALSITQTKKYSNQRPLEVNGFLQIFVQEDDIVTCPRLEYFTFEGRIDLSLQTLRGFLEGKQRGIATRHSLSPWKGVALDLARIPDPNERTQMWDMCSQKLKEGLNVSIVKISIFDF